MKYVLRMSILFVLSVLISIDAHGQLPPEAEAKLLDREILSHIESGDLINVVNLIENYKTIGVPVPETYLFIQGKILGSQNKHAEAKLSVEQYFQAAELGHPKYDDALKLYEIYNNKTKDLSINHADSFVAEKRYASMILDNDTLKILHARQIDEPRFPASLSQVMTLHLAFDALEDGRLLLDEQLDVSLKAAQMPPNRLGLKTGQSIKVHDLIQSVAIRSHNDSAIVLAEHLGGTENEFAKMMTAKARSLGMNNTTFMTATGLPHPQQVTTARDMAKLAQAIFKNHRNQYHYFGQEEFRGAKNGNSLVNDLAHVDGLKVGYARASGYNLMLSATRYDRRLITIVLGGNSGKNRNQHALDLIERGFDVLGVPKTFSEVNSNLESWGIQVGAFLKESEAREQISTVQNLNGLSKSRPNVSPMTRNGQTLYRARFDGLKVEDAQAACKALAGLSSGCLIIAESTNSNPTSKLSDLDDQKIQSEIKVIGDTQSRSVTKNSSGSSLQKKHGEHSLDGVAYTTYVMDRGDPCTVVPKRKFDNLELIETVKIWYIVNSKKTRSGKFRSGMPYRVKRSPGIYKKGDPVTYSYEPGQTTIGDGHAKLCTYKVTDFKSAEDLSKFKSKYANGITLTEAKNKALDELKTHSSVYTSLKSACDAISNWKYYNDNAHCTGGLK